VSEKKPLVITFPAVQKHCPVCGKVSYSLSGEHPQCSVERGDPRAKRRKQQSRKPVLASVTPLASGRR